MCRAQFALGLLPPSSCPAIVLLTDGISELPENLAYDSSFMRLCRANTPVIVLPVGDPAHLPPYGPLGYVEDWELVGVRAPVGAACVDGIGCSMWPASHMAQC